MEDNKPRVFINNVWENVDHDIHQIKNPATLEPLGSISYCTKEIVDKAVQSAKNAQRSWWKTPGVEKAALLREVAHKIKENGGKISRMLSLETGKPLIEAADTIEWVTSCFEYYAEISRNSYGNSIPPGAPHQINFTIKEPFGVVAAIVPFNFPLLLTAWKIAPAIAAGNTVVVKPPHQNPLSSLMFADAFTCLPPGVVNFITGGGETGENLVRHPDVDMIAFTGSTQAGRKIAAIAGEHLKKVNLELGGIDPIIVFKDADLNVAVPGVAWARLLNAGQVCTSSKRIYVEAPIYDEFVTRIKEYVSSLKVGNPQDPDTDIGPLISAEQVALVESQVKEAINQKAKLILGGKRFQPNGLPGYFFEPTILVDVIHGSLPTVEEIFGPVLSIIKANDADHAIQMANDSKYGLGASIFTDSLQVAMKAMENIKAGSFWINDPLTDNDAGPFGGMRWSGMGRELGEEGLDAYREPKHVHMDYIMEKKSYWFPYSQRKKELEHKL